MRKIFWLVFLSITPALADVALPALTPEEVPKCVATINAAVNPNIVGVISCGNEVLATQYHKADYPWMDIVYKYEADILQQAIDLDAKKITYDQYVGLVKKALLDFKGAESQRYQAEMAELDARGRALSSELAAEQRASDMERSSRRSRILNGFAHDLLNPPQPTFAPSFNCRSYQNGPYTNTNCN